MERISAINAIRDGASIAGTARRFGVSRSTLYRWRRCFDRDHPVASLRPRKRGPKLPRWDPKIIDLVIDIVGSHEIPAQPTLLGTIPARQIPPNQWGRRRLTKALAERGIELSEATAGRILRLAREQIAQEQERRSRDAMASRRRETRKAAKKLARVTERRQFVRTWLQENYRGCLTTEEGGRRMVEALATGGFKFHIKDLTPELVALADAHILRYENFSGIIPDELDWFVRVAPRQLRSGSYGEGHISNTRVGALNHLVHNWAAELQRLPEQPSKIEDHR
ncbi:MAG: helix-turn-helix domain-containing protein [Rhodomicrobium sp.]